MSNPGTLKLPDNYSPSADADSELTWADCKAGRKPFGENLVNLLTGAQHHFTIAIDNPWGTGKTHFINTLRPILTEKAVPHVTLNAWDSDYLDDPLSAIVLQLYDHLEGGHSIPEEIKDGVVIAAKEVKDILCEKLADVALRTCTKSLIAPDS